MKHPNCNCMPELEITCTDIESDYEVVDIPKPEIITVDLKNFDEETQQKLEQYNEDNKDCCPNFKPWPTTKDGWEILIHETAMEMIPGGIHNFLETYCKKKE